MSQIHRKPIFNQRPDQTEDSTAQSPANLVPKPLVPLMKSFWLMVGAFLLCFEISRQLMPDLRDTFWLSSAEGQLIEVLAMVLYMVGFIWGVRSLFRLPKALRWRYLPIPVLSFLGFWDELSFTESVLRIPAMRLYDVRFDALHDVIEIAYMAGQEHRWILHSLIGLAIGSMVLLVLKHRQIWRFIMRYPAYQFVAIAAVLLIIPMTIDVIFPLNAAVNHFEELLETSAALAFVFAAMSIEEVRREA